MTVWEFKSKDSETTYKAYIRRVNGNFVLEVKMLATIEGLNDAYIVIERLAFNSLTELCLYMQKNYFVI